MLCFILLILRADAQVTSPGNLDLDFITESLDKGYEDSAPIITLPLSSVTAPPGGSVTLSCAAQGSPRPTVQLTKREESVIPDVENSVEAAFGGTVSVSLSLTKLSVSGWYRCIAFNNKGYVYSDMHLTVKDLCEGVECNGGKTCVADYNPSSGAPPPQAPGSGHPILWSSRSATSCRCTETCETVINAEPVCGGDCAVHFSECHWSMVACANNYPLTILAKGTVCPDIVMPSVEITSGTVSVLEDEAVILEVVALTGSPTPAVTWYKEGVVEVQGEGMVLSINQSNPTHSGKYYARAVNCGANVAASEIVDVIVGVVVPPEGTKVCSVYGDPHVQTFDGLSYKVGGECHYVLAMECKAMSWIVYGYFTKCGGASCLQSVAVYHGRDSLVLDRGWVVRYNGERHDYGASATFSIASFDLAFDGLHLTVTVAGGIQVVWDGFTGVQISLSGQAHKDTVTCGICGNNDGDADNEMTQLREIGDSDGSLAGFVHSWTVDDKELCEAPSTVKISELEPCGAGNFAANEAAKLSCRKLVESHTLVQCWTTVEILVYFRSCLVDTCSFDMLTEQIPVRCNMASAYVKTCELVKGVMIYGDWRREMGCPEASAIQQSIAGFAVKY